MNERRKKLLEESEAECVVLINIEGSSRPSLIYYTGFTGTFATLVLSKSGEWLITDPRYTEQARVQTDIEVVEYRSDKKFHEFLADFLKDVGCGEIGLEKSKINLAFYESLSGALGNVEFVSVDEIVASHRMNKAGDEIDRIRKAIEIAQKAFLDTLDVVKIGMTEREVAAYLEYKMKSLGSEGAAFPTIVASGWRSALPHGIASDKEIDCGEPVVVDFGAVYEGYVSDITRVFVIGEPSERLLEIHDTVKRAQDVVFEKAKPGMTGVEIDAIARNFLKDEGYENEFGHGLGHGIGLEVHEYPGINKRWDKPVEVGMVFTVEPGLYFPGEFGVRIEEDVLMKDDGIEILTSLPRDVFVLEG